MGAVPLDNAGKAYTAIVGPDAGQALLLAVGYVGLIQYIPYSCVMVAKLFGKRIGSSYGVHSTAQGDGTIYVKPTELFTIEFYIIYRNILFKGFLL